MPEHKDATEVAYATTSDESEFTLWVLRWWKLGSLILLGGAAPLVLVNRQQHASHAEQVTSWEKLGEAISVDSLTQTGNSDAATISAVADSQSANASGPWARYLEASVRDMDGDEPTVAGFVENVDHPCPVESELLGDLALGQAGFVVIPRHSGCELLNVTLGGGETHELLFAVGTEI